MTTALLLVIVALVVYVLKLRREAVEWERVCRDAIAQARQALTELRSSHDEIRQLLEHIREAVR